MKQPSQEWGLSTVHIIAKMPRSFWVPGPCFCTSLWDLKYIIEHSISKSFLRSDHARSWRLLLSLSWTKRKLLVKYIFVAWGRQSDLCNFIPLNFHLFHRLIFFKSLHLKPEGILTILCVLKSLPALNWYNRENLKKKKKKRTRVALRAYS